MSATSDKLYTGAFPCRHTCGCLSLVDNNCRSRYHNEYKGNRNTHEDDPRRHPLFHRTPSCRYHEAQSMLVMPRAFLTEPKADLRFESDGEEVEEGQRRSALQKEREAYRMCWAKNYPKHPRQVLIDDFTLPFWVKSRGWRTSSSLVWREAPASEGEAERKEGQAQASDEAPVRLPSPRRAKALSSSGRRGRRPPTLQQSLPYQRPRPVKRERAKGETKAGAAAEVPREALKAWPIAVHDPRQWLREHKEQPSPAAAVAPHPRQYALMCGGAAHIRAADLSPLQDAMEKWSARHPDRQYVIEEERLPHPLPSSAATSPSSFLSSSPPRSSSTAASPRLQLDDDEDVQIIPTPPEHRAPLPVSKTEPPAREDSSSSKRSRLVSQPGHQPDRAQAGEHGRRARLHQHLRRHAGERGHRGPEEQGDGRPRLRQQEGPGGVGLAWAGGVI